MRVDGQLQFLGEMASLSCTQAITCPPCMKTGQTSSGTATSLVIYHSMGTYTATGAMIILVEPTGCWLVCSALGAINTFENNRSGQVSFAQMSGEKLEMYCSHDCVVRAPHQHTPINLQHGIASKMVCGNFEGKISPSWRCSPVPNGTISAPVSCFIQRACLQIPSKQSNHHMMWSLIIVYCTLLV